MVAWVAYSGDRLKFDDFEVGGVVEAETVDNICGVFDGVESVVAVGGITTQVFVLWVCVDDCVSEGSVLVELVERVCAVV